MAISSAGYPPTRPAVSAGPFWVTLVVYMTTYVTQKEGGTFRG
jgi:hypothetical protein